MRRGKGRIMVLARACDGPFPIACRGKGHLMDLVCARDGLYPLSVEEKSVSGLPGIPQRGPERSPKVARELPIQKTNVFVLDLLLKQC